MAKVTYKDPGSLISVQLDVSKNQSALTDMTKNSGTWIYSNYPEKIGKTDQPGGAAKGVSACRA